MWDVLLENDLPVFFWSPVCQINHFLPVRVCPETKVGRALLRELDWNKKYFILVSI